MSRAAKHLTLAGRIVRALSSNYPKHRLPRDVARAFTESAADVERGNQ